MPDDVKRFKKNRHNKSKEKVSTVQEVARKRLEELKVKRVLGFFCNGLEPHVYCWEVRVKKLYLLLVGAVAYNRAVYDPRPGSSCSRRPRPSSGASTAW